MNTCFTRIQYVSLYYLNPIHIETSIVSDSIKISLKVQLISPKVEHLQQKAI